MKSFSSLNFRANKEAIKLQQLECNIEWLWARIWTSDNVIRRRKFFWWHCSGEKDGERSWWWCAALGLCEFAFISSRARVKSGAVKLQSANQTENSNIWLQHLSSCWLSYAFSMNLMSFRKTWMQDDGNEAKSSVNIW